MTDPILLETAKRFAAAMHPVEVQKERFAQGITAIQDQIRNMIGNDPFIKEEPEVGAMYVAMMEEMQKESMDQVLASIPQMFEAMSHAFAAKLSLEDMEAGIAFYSSEAGQRCVAAQTQSASDPHVIEWSQHMMLGMQSLSEKKVKDFMAAVDAMDEARANRVLN